MRWAFSVIFVCAVASLFVPHAYAIIFLPAIVLIPIAKIVALIIFGFSFPALGIGVLWSKLFGKSLKKTLTIIIFLLLLLAAILVVVFKIYNPERPLF